MEMPGMLGLALYWFRALRYVRAHGPEYDALWLQSPMVPFPRRVADLGPPVVFTFHASYIGLYRAHLRYGVWYLVPYYLLGAAIERVLLLQLSKEKGRIKVTTVSPAARAELIANGLRSQIVSIPNASRFANSIPIAKSAARRMLRERGIMINDGDKVVIYVGRVTPGKRPLDVVGLFKQLRARNRMAKLLVVGDGVLLDAVRKQGAVIGGVYAPGYIPSEDLPVFYQAADLFVSMSLHEAFDLAAIEASGFGLPVALSAIDAHRWLIESGLVRGLLITESTGAADLTKLLEEGGPVPHGTGSATLNWDDIAASYLELLKGETA